MDKYEKLYNEALERFKSFKEKYYTKDTNLGDVIFDKNGEMQKDFNGIFLELAESEDERIRKEMVEKISNLACGCFISQEQKQKFIAYLEKQKEQKHPNGCFTCDEYKKGYEEGRRNGFTAGYNKAMKEVEQKEQKPWKVGANAYFTPEQKPEEWSEGDEKIVNNIVSVLGQYIDYKAVSGTGSGYATPRYAKEIDWLNSLRTTNQGWGKEDEEMRKLLIAILEVNHPDGFFKANELGTTNMRGVHTEEIISWLKSLRPSWKPSEEQMEAFRSYIKDFQEKAEAAVGGWNNFDVMIRLFEQLKKLKGGVAPMREIDE